MFKTILVPLDGSLRAEDALPIAEHMARHTGGMLVLVRVVSFASEYWPAVPAPMLPVMRSAVDGDLQEATLYLKQVAASAELTGIEAITIARHGAATPVILTAALESRADLIVMCSHSHTGVAHVLQGRVTEKIARHAPVPVLVVREKGSFPAMNSAEVAQPLRLLVPLDGSPSAKAALEPAAELLSALAAPAQKTALHLIRVIEPAAGQKEEAQIAQRRRLCSARNYLSRTTDLIRDGYIAPSISRQHIPVNWSVALDHDCVRAIVRVAENGEDAEGAGVFGGCQQKAMRPRRSSPLPRASKQILF
jgi:nucleotide-binding universal stress UspA family protein